MIYPEVQAARIMVKTHLPKFLIYWISSKPSITSNTTANTEILVISLCFYIGVFKLKTKVIIGQKLLMQIELNEFGGKGMHFHKGILLSYVAEYPFKKLQYVQKGSFFCIRGKDWYIDTKSDDEESILRCLNKNSVPFYF